nr:gag pol polyprotein [Hymenolepis microstoma]
MGVTFQMLTHTGLQQSDPLRRFNRIVAPKHSFYNKVHHRPFRKEIHPTECPPMGYKLPHLSNQSDKQTYRSPLSGFPLPEDRFRYIRVDIVGPLPPSNFFTHILNCIGHFKRWPIAVLLCDTSSESVAKALVE